MPGNATVCCAVPLALVKRIFNLANLAAPQFSDCSLAIPGSTTGTPRRVGPHSPE
jgi:hypothetical protein